jgi:hypothetical protein
MWDEDAKRLGWSDYWHSKCRIYSKCFWYNNKLGKKPNCEFCTTHSIPLDLVTFDDDYLTLIP